MLQSVNTTTYALSKTQIDEYVSPERNKPAQLINARILGVVMSDTHFCSICRVAAVPIEELYKCPGCSSVMLSKMLRKKSTKKITVLADKNQIQLQCHDSVITSAFPASNIEEMDIEQLSLLLLKPLYTMEYDSSTGNIIALMPVQE